MPGARNHPRPGPPARRPEGAALGVTARCDTPRPLPPPRRSDLLADPGSLAAELAEVVQLRAPDGAATLDLHLGDVRAVQRKHALHAFAMGNLAHRERGIEAAVAPCDDDTLVGLQTLAVAFLHPDLDDDGVAGSE